MKHITRLGALATLSLSLLALPGITPNAEAKARHSLRWTGQVDSIVDVYFRGGRSWVETVSGKEKPDMGVTRFSSNLPRRNVIVAANKQLGRGKITVQQQPTARNNYTAVVRIEDPKGGADRYRFNLVWDN
ncbi:MAG: hypothetical protein QM758_19370 [Armatimonas sp.]